VEVGVGDIVREGVRERVALEEGEKERV